MSEEMTDETPQTMKQLRPSIDDVVDAAQRGVIIDWSDNPALYSAPVDLVYPEPVQQTQPRRQKSSRRKEVAS